MASLSQDSSAIRGSSHFIELADMVLYYRFGMNDEVWCDWVEECKRLAIMTENESFLERLINRLGIRVNDDESLKKVIDKKLTDSERVKRAFWSKISRRGG